MNPLKIRALVWILTAISIFGSITLSFQTYQLISQFLNLKKKSDSLIVSEAFVSRDTLIFTFRKEEDFTNKLLSLVVNRCDESKVGINKILTPKFTNNEVGTIITQEILLQGDFISVLKVLSQVHTDLYPIKITSLKFELVSISNRDPVLTLRVFFTGIIKDYEE